MEYFFVLLAVVLLAFLIKTYLPRRSAPVPQSQAEAMQPLGSASRGPQYGRVTATHDGKWILNPSSTFPLSISGVDQETAEQVRAAMDISLSKGSWVSRDALIPLVARSNLRCTEIDAYVHKHRPAYLAKVTELRASCREWEAASEMDREDLLQGFREQAMRLLDVRPSADLEVLFETEPKDATIDDALLERYGAERLRLYLRYFDESGKVRSVSVGNPERSGFESLAESGLAFRGWEIAVNKILETMTLKEMQGLIVDLNPPTFHRKSKAVEFITQLPDVRERVGRTVALRELFQLRSLPEEFSGIALEEVSAAWAYAAEVSDLMVQTFIRAGQEASQQDSHARLRTVVEGWRIRVLNDETCCPFCRRAAAESHAPQERPGVPLHLGCTCWVQPLLPGDSP